MTKKYLNLNGFVVDPEQFALANFREFANRPYQLTQPQEEIRKLFKAAAQQLLENEPEITGHPV